jgi:hypothetical protein
MEAVEEGRSGDAVLDNKKHPPRYHRRYGLVQCLACSYAFVHASDNITVISERGYTLRSCV